MDIILPQLPLPDPEETVAVVLEPPVGHDAKLADDDATCTTTIVHDIGELTKEKSVAISRRTQAVYRPFCRRLKCR